jgi:DNA repair protein RAD50
MASVTIPIHPNNFQLCAESEVLGQVKLQFRNASNSKLVVTRSISLTVKKSKTTQKTLDCELLMDHKGERVTMSTKVGEMNKVIPMHLGVPPAILENVIFCHQDESLWPMSEPTKLKAKFDEIFEAQKYTKAIDAIKSMGKQHNIKLGQLVIHENNFKILKDRAERVQKQSEALQAEIEEIREKITTVEEKIVEATEDRKEKHKRAIQALGIVDELKTKTQRAQYLEATLSDLRENFEERHESDQELQSILEQFEETMAEYSRQLAEHKDRYQELQDSADDCQRRMSAKQAERGQHQAEKESYERQLESRVQVVKNAARDHSIRGYEGDIDEDQIKDFVARIQKEARDRDLDLERITTESNEELRKTQNALSELESQRVTRTEKRLAAQQAITANNKREDLKMKEQASINIEVGTMAALNADLIAIKDRLEQARSSFENASWNSKIAAEDNRLAELEFESNRLRDELVKSNRLAQDHAALTHQKTMAKQKQTALNTMISTYTDQLNEVVGSDWEPDSLEREFQTVLDQRLQTLADAKKQQDGAHQELREQEIKLQTTRSTLSQKKVEMQKAQIAVLNAILTDDKPLNNVDDYLPELETLENERNQVRQDLDGITYVSDYYRQGLEIIKQKNCCRLCDRTFADRKEKTAAMDKIEKTLAKYVKKDLEDDLKVLEDELKTANQARSQYDLYKKLHDTEVPALEKEVEGMERKKRTLVQRLEQCDNVVSQEESAKRDVEALSPTVNNITKYCLEISAAETDIARLSSQQKLSSSSLSADEIQEQSASCDERIRAVKKTRTRLVDDRDHAKAEINKLEIDLGNISNKALTAKGLFENKQRLIKEVEELREHTKLQREVIREADEALTALSPQFAKAKALHEDAQRRGQAKAKNVQAEKTKIGQTINGFKLIQDNITAYLEDGGPAKLAACQRAIKTLEQEAKQIKADTDQVTAATKSLMKKVDDGEHNKKIIQDNIRYRKNLRDLQLVKNDIAELEDRNVTDDYAHLLREAQRADKKWQTLQSEQGPLVGAITAKDSQLADLIEEYDREYRDAAEKYKEMHIKVETTKAAIEDMKKYSSALDSAIMKFHSLKMQEINAIASELWRSTYQGTDVDSIMIRSENDTANTTTKRSYNYRVVMTKQDAEMDMRGRCSAGQKVLACIIIRLALAECFGQNCGVSICLISNDLTLTDFRSLLLMNRRRTLIKTTLKLSLNL